MTVIFAVLAYMLMISAAIVHEVKRRIADKKRKSKTPSIRTNERSIPKNMQRRHVVNNTDEL